MTHHDVIVIGSGTAGQTVAAACAREGRSVAVIDRLPFGGTCALRGCQPKKVLLAGVEAMSRAQGLESQGIAGGCELDWPALMARKERFIGHVPDSTVGRMSEMGIATVSGTARFVAEDTIDVDGATLTAGDIVVATGARPIPLGIDGEELVSSSTDFLSLVSMPARVVFIGGGYVSFEFARLAQLAGADVTIVHRSLHVLKGFDKDLADMVVRRYRELGIEVMLDAPVEQVAEAQDGALLVVTGAGEMHADAAFHGAGRMPDLADLDLETGGVAHNRKGVSVDASLRSVSNPHVWAAGDAASLGAPLTPVAGAQGEVVAAGILGRATEYDDSVTPSVVFTDPPLAAVGIGASAAEDDSALEVRAFDMSGWFTQTRVGNSAAGARLVVEKASGAILGAHLLSVGADEVINVFAAAMSVGATLDDLKSTTWSYPTLAYDINYLTGRY